MEDKKMDRNIALMALSLSETLCLAKAMNMQRKDLLKELGELLDYAQEHPIFLTEPNKWVKLNSLFRAGVYRKIIKTSVPPLTCVQQHILSEKDHSYEIGADKMEAEREKK